MFDWIGDLIDSVVGAIQDGFEWIGEVLLGQIWNTMMQWLYETVYTAVADFFALMGNMGADIFNLSWVQATVELFTLFGWALFVAGVVVAIFDVAIEYQNGRADIKSCAINILKGFFACSLIGVVPIELYKFCISLQNTFASEIAAYAGSTQSFDLSITAQGVLVGSFFAGNLSSQLGLFTLLCLIAFGYCVVKIFFQNIKRGGILLVQMAVGSLYMFSVPRGYHDGFVQWMKQVIAICLTAFMQTTLLYLGLMTFPGNMLLGLGIMLAANEVPRIAQQFGLDSSVRVNMMSVVHATTTLRLSSRVSAKTTSSELDKEKTMSKNLVTMTIEIDREVYNKAAELFKNLGTTIEDITVGFLKFCVIPENLPVLKAYFGRENAPAEAGAQMELHHRIFKQVFDIATKNTG